MVSGNILVLVYIIMVGKVPESIIHTVKRPLSKSVVNQQSSAGIQIIGGLPQ